MDEYCFMKENHFSDQKTKKKSVVFPVKIQQVTSGTTIELTMNEGTEVSCAFCGEKFKIDRTSAYHLKSYMVDVDDNIPFVKCPKCNRRCSIVHYFDRLVNSQTRQPKKNRYAVSEVVTISEGRKSR